VVQYRIHTTETLNYLADYLEQFNATEDVFTTYRTSKATDTIAHACMEDLKMQVKAEDAIEDEKRAERGEALSRAQKEHRKAKYKKLLQEVYNSTVHERTSFDFVKIHLMLHYEESVHRFGHLVKDSTEAQEMNHPKRCMGPYRRSNSYFRYERQILNDYSLIHVLRMWCLHLWQLAKEGHWTPEIQQALQLYRPKDQIVVNKLNRKQVPKPENLPFSFREDEGNIQVRGLRSPRRKGFFVKNESLPMYNFPLVEYIYRYYTYDHNIPTSDRRGIAGMRATQFDLLNVPVANLQSFGGCDSTAHKLRWTDDKSFHNAQPRHDCVWFQVVEPPKGDVGDLPPAQHVRILRLQDGLRKRCVVLFRQLQLEKQSVCVPFNGLLRFSDKVFRRNQADLVVVNIKCIWAAAHLVHIPGTRYYYVNNAIDLVMFNRF